ncbi:DUF418 domain-containing protein [Larkinella sp. GY13]|uniref:DUF418 domain-containing protein n=1 Tax=Larkinella sp. GY13 TaxID=3453720 RepID=UPI003EED89DE
MASIGSFQATQPHERIHLMDGLRGFALFGILIVNTWSFSRVEWLPVEQQTQHWLTDSLKILVDTKFITIFSMLFGAGFYLQQQRALAKGVNFPAYYTKRMLFLFVIACLHAYLFWFGDIVRNYALLGVALLTVRHLSAKATLRLALLFIGFLTPVTYILNEAIGKHTNPDQVDGMPLTTYIFTAFTTGSYPQILRANWIIDPWHNFIQDLPIALVAMFGRMLLGVWLAKIGFFRNPAAHQRLIGRWLWWGGTVGVSSSVAFWAMGNGRLPMDELYMIPVIFLVTGGLVLHSLFYVGLFIKSYSSSLGTLWQGSLVPVGRIGLTNYFSQTVLAFTFFYSTGMIGHIAPTILLGCALGLFAIQVLLSRWWLSNHKSGPVEWAWRVLSYWAVGAISPKAEPTES